MHRSPRQRVCPECDLLQREPPLTGPGRVRCARCRALLYRHGAGGITGGIDRGLAYASTAAIAFVLANVAPVVALEARGRRTSATVLGTAIALRAQHRSVLAALVFATALLMPGLEIGLTLYVLGSLRRAQRSPSLPMRLLALVRPWSMVDVFVVGTLASLGRLSQVADVQFGWGVGGLAALVLAMAASREAQAEAQAETPGSS